uniref:Uncharacterized protein n=1 Tax=Knipowitschia caucasica TaxID=637954 RepID=A0AAV2J009_KNICA
MKERNKREERNEREERNKREERNEREERNRVAGEELESGNWAQALSAARSPKNVSEQQRALYRSIIKTPVFQWKD